MKRVMDLVFVLLAIPLWVPVLVVVGLLVRLKLGRPVFFVQIRPGLHARPFRLVKFRSMTDELDADGVPLADAQRLTRFGRILRASSLDELPELWNVLRGEMSLVGPRPLLLEYLPLYSDAEARRHAVRPGITGWSQVNGRNAVTWEERLKMDQWYVDNQSLVLDVTILWRTFCAVVTRRGINADGEVTMPKFRGSADNQAPSSSTN